MNAIPSLDRFAIYDKRPRLLEKEKKEIRHTVRAIFDVIKERAKQVNPDDIYDDENELARGIHEYHERSIDIKKLRGKLIAIKKISDEVERLCQERPIRPKTVIQIARLSTNKVRHGNEDEIQEELERLQDMSSINSLEGLYLARKATLTVGMTGRLDQDLKKTISELIVELCDEHKKQGKPAHTKDALTIMVHELIYGDYLWRNETRKDGETSYFRSHLIAAAKNQVKHGFTSVMSLLCAIKHDDAEDLSVHREGCWKKRVVDTKTQKNKKMEYKSEWLFCDDVYRDQLTPEGILDEKVCPHARLRYGKPNVERTVLALSSPEKEEKVLDEEKAVKYLNELLRNGYAAALKVIEQIQNGETIKGLAQERQEEKLRLILVLHGMMAKALEMKYAECKIVGAGIDYYNPALRNWFNSTQKGRVRDRLGLIKGRIAGDALTACLVKGKTAKIEIGTSLESPIGQLLELCSNSSEVETEIRKVQRKILGVVKPMHDGIVSIEIRPIPIEEYLDVNAFLANPMTYRPEIAPDDPMFEVVVCVKEPDEKSNNYAWDTATEILRHFRPDRRSTIDPEIPPHDRPQMGYELEMIRQELGGKFRFRVNTAQNEASSKRGLRARQTGEHLPDWLRERVKETLRVAKYRTDSIFTIAEEILMRKVMKVETDEAKRERVYLNEGDTMLDFAASLPTRKAIQALIYGIKAFKIVDGQRVQVSMFDPLKEDDICYTEVQLPDKGDEWFIEVDGADDPSVHFDLAHLVFSNSGKPRGILKKWVASEYQTGKERRDKRSYMAEYYLDRLRSIFGFNDLPEELLKIACLLRLKQYPAKTIHKAIASGNENRIDGARENYIKKRELNLVQIGNGNLDPLRVLANYVDPRFVENKRPCRIEIEATHESGPLADIAVPLKDAEINVRSIHNEDALSDVTKLHMTLIAPEGMSTYDYLKLILRLSLDYKVTVLSNLFTFDKDTELQEALGDNKSLRELERLAQIVQSL